ncbi:hypothetical protein [Streptomyces luteogriseus]|uniref:hypothetical protein n=1 Tax=Streptomyces luteogriseus TaxID=68233 RepID=UPI0037F9D296
MSEPIRDTETAVRKLGALPVPIGTAAPLTPQGRTRTMLDHARDALNARMTKDDLRLVLENVVTYAAVLEARLDEAQQLTAQATEFRLWEPGYGLYVRRAPGAQGFAVLEARRSDKGRRAWTTAGWQYCAILSDTELFCWPDAGTAVTEARRVMPGAVVREADE